MRGRRKKRERELNISKFCTSAPLLFCQQLHIQHFDEHPTTTFLIFSAGAYSATTMNVMDNISAGVLIKNWSKSDKNVENLVARGELPVVMFMFI